MYLENSRAHLRRNESFLAVWSIVNVGIDEQINNELNK